MKQYNMMTHDTLYTKLFGLYDKRIRVAPWNQTLSQLNERLEKQGYILWVLQDDIAELYE